MNLDTRWVFFLIAITAAAPGSAQPKITAVVNSATFQSDTPRGGALATIFCSGLQDYFAPGTYIAPQAKPLPTELDNPPIRVQINGFLAPILAVVVGTDGSAQINIQVPPGADAATSSLIGSGLIEACHDQNTYSNLRGGSLFSGGFFSDAKGYAIAQHASDYSLVTIQNPAHAGEAIIVYANDFFSVWPPPPIAFATPSQPLFVATQSPGGLYLDSYFGPVMLTGPATLPIHVTFEGLAPGQLGVEQINFVVPANQQPGDWALFYSVTSNFKSYNSAYVTLPVR